MPKAFSILVWNYRQSTKIGKFHGRGYFCRMKLSLFAQEIADALTDNGIGLRISGCGEPVLFSASGKGGYRAMFLVLDPISENPEEAERLSVAIMSELNEIQTAEGIRPAIIVRDLWERQPQMMTERMLAHCGIFTSVFARNCEVRRIDRATANAFLDKTHSYGGALCRHCYGLYIRNGVSGQTAQGQDGNGILSIIGEDRPVAVAEFSNARKWTKDGREIRSYEWIRYASLPGMRITGGMGQLLKRFIDDIRPDDIMSYADMEWSDGSVYRQLGFNEEGYRTPVLFSIDRTLWTRTPAGSPRHRPEEPFANHTGQPPKVSYYHNLGSIKFRLTTGQQG